MKKTAFNTNLIFFILLFSVFLFLTIFFLTDSEEKDVALFVAGLFLCAVPVFAIVISPLLFIFENDKLTIVYCFGFKEEISWREIKSISKWGGWFRGNGRGFPIYEISYPTRKKLPYFAQAHIPHNKKTAKLLQSFYKKKINEYWD